MFLQVWGHGGCEEAEDASDGPAVQMWRRCFTGQTQTRFAFGTFLCAFPLNERTSVLRLSTGSASCWTLCWRPTSGWAMTPRRPGPCWTSTRSLWTSLRWGCSICQEHTIIWVLWRSLRFSRTRQKNVFSLWFPTEHPRLWPSAAAGHRGPLPVAAMHHPLVRGHAAPTQPGLEAVHRQCRRAAAKTGAGPELSHGHWEGESAEQSVTLHVQ